MKLYQITYTSPNGSTQFAIVSQACSNSFLTRLEIEGSILKGMKRI